MVDRPFKFKEEVVDPLSAAARVQPNFLFLRSSSPPS
jgi:hypothetical protein